MRRVLLMACFLAGCAGCEGCGGEAAQQETAATPTTESSSGSTVGPVGAAPGSPEAPTGVEVRTEVDRYGRATVAVENRSGELARIAPSLRAGDETLALRLDCDAEPPACIELAPGAVLYPCDCGGCEDITPDTAFHLAPCP